MRTITGDSREAGLARTILEAVAEAGQEFREGVRRDLGDRWNATYPTFDPDANLEYHARWTALQAEILVLLAELEPIGYGTCPVCSRSLDAWTCETCGHVVPEWDRE